MAKLRKAIPCFQFNNMSIMCFLGLLFSFVLPLSAMAEDQYRYEPSKMVESQAKLHCQSLANISLGRQESLSIAAYTKPKTVGISHKGKKVVGVSYPYRQDNISFVCLFYDYTDGQLQLMEFGHSGPNTDDVTKVKLLY